ncbi:MAG: cellulase family glycosylhydrolase [Alphaproteobacteria bacterium]|nr:cellulase family glycosylhydrolase [Alphaproteobacteria bacterium]
MARVVLLCLLLVLTSMESFAQAVSGFGIQIKADRITDQELAQIAAMGFDRVRFDMPWPYVEHQKGRYDWRFYDRLIEKLEKHHLGAVIHLGVGHVFYGGLIEAPPNAFGMTRVQAAPASDEARAAFTAFAREAVKRYHNIPLIWTIWNEPDHAIFWPPAPDAKAYTSLAMQVCKVMREVRPDAFIAAPDLAFASQGDVVADPFLNALVRHPDFSCLDGFSLHPYRDGAIRPESVVGFYDAVRAFFAKHGLKNFPLLSTEWGYSTRYASPQQQAAYALRSYLINKSQGVDVTIWYEWKSLGSDPDNAEDQFGFLDGRGHVKESLALVAQGLEKLKGLIILERVDVGADDVWVLRAKRASDQAPFLIFWLAREQDDPARHLALRENGQESFYRLTIFPWVVALKDDKAKIFLPPAAERLIER